MKASDKSIEVVQWQVKYTEWRNFPKCAAAIAEKAYAEGKQDSVTYHQRRTALPTLVEHARGWTNASRVDGYRIDFHDMRQTNLVSGRSREVRRCVVARPKLRPDVFREARSACIGDRLNGVVTPQRRSAKIDPDDGTSSDDLHSDLHKLERKVLENEPLPQLGSSNQALLNNFYVNARRDIFPSWAGADVRACVAERERIAAASARRFFESVPSVVIHADDL